MIPACDAIWQVAVKKRDEAYESKWAAKAKVGALADKPIEIESAGDKAFHRCFAEKARTAGFFSALRRQAQELSERVGGK